VIIPSERNLILNPKHARYSAEVRLIQSLPFFFDPGIFSSRIEAYIRPLPLDNQVKPLQTKSRALLECQVKTKKKSPCSRERWI
jgi:hypothetical protein